MCEHLCLKQTQEDFFRRLKTINFESLHVTITMSYCKAKTMEWNCMSLRNVMFVCEKTSVDISLQMVEGYIICRGLLAASLLFTSPRYSMMVW